ncbi:MAG: hypothetical protein Q9216_005079, partial [Gyalolechia sp. 2 TL-2023]
MSPSIRILHYIVPETNVELEFILFLRDPIESDIFSLAIQQGIQEIRGHLIYEGDGWLKQEDDPFFSIVPGRCSVRVDSVKRASGRSNITYKTLLASFVGMWNRLYVEEEEWENTSGSSYKFSETVGFNDERALSNALGKMKIGDPASHGGIFHDDTDVAKQYESFNIHTPPDTTPNTHIVAVCGVGQEDAGPGDDGWFLSDFFAFYHLLDGATAHQHWIHCLDLEKLVNKHHQYLHGNPFKTRKIVLDQGILDRATNLTRISTAGGLSLAFEQRLRNACRAAAQAGNESVLVLMFGHGSKRNGGVELGTKTFKQDQFSKAIGNTNIPVTIVSTACFSGGWSCNKEFDRSKRHYNKTGTQFATFGRRACGSIFATAIIKSLIKVGHTQKPLMGKEGEDDEESDDAETTDEQEASMEELTRVVYETLLQDTDRRGFEHEFTFSAEEDAWGMSWRERSGIPLTEFKDRWDQLENHEPDPYLHPGDPMNRDPHVTKEQEADYLTLKAADQGRNFYGLNKGAASASVGSKSKSVLGKRNTSALCGGGIQAMVNQISHLGGQYLQSYRGFEESGEDGALYNLITRIQHGEETNLEQLQKCQRSLDYRMNQMTAADDYLQKMAIPQPRGQSCHEFDTRGIVKGVGQSLYGATLGAIMTQRILFPHPVEDQGRPFGKGPDYLVAAFYFAKLDKATVDVKLDDLAKIVRQEVEYQKDLIKNLPEVRSKRQKLFRAFGIDIGNISPAKRHSRGLSL